MQELLFVLLLKTQFALVVFKVDQHNKLVCHSTLNLKRCIIN